MLAKSVAVLSSKQKRSSIIIMKAEVFFSAWGFEREEAVLTLDCDCQSPRSLQYAALL